LEFIDAMPSFQPDCLILDVQMPGMNGLDVQQQLVSRSSRLPIVFITATMSWECASGRRLPER
jgi:FixJ family two-component response regulator